MKKFLSVLLMVAGLMSCGDDDKPFIPELSYMYEKRKCFF